jgi:transcriptional regulator with XRE-family HTH domain
MTAAEVVRQLKIIRYSSQHERNARRAPSIHGIAKAAGLSRGYVNQIANGERKPGPHAQEMLSLALTCKQGFGERNAGRRPETDPRSVSAEPGSRTFISAVFGSKRPVR